MNIVTRIAPSPTGKFLHIGNLRTLLYNYFLAKRHGGKFLVRLEDTDRDRYTPEFLDYFKDTLNWLGIVPDFSYWNPDPTLGSFIQTERDYSDKIKFLLDNGYAYYAYDTKDELTTLQDKKLKYDSTTRMSMNNSLTNGVDLTKSYVVRFKVDPDTNISFTDAVLGDITINTNQLDDKVLLKSNGVGSYHLCNVCDDHDMGITHVLRGQEWVASTPFHILIYKAFGWDLPVFAHLPLIMNPDGKGKLSKRTASKYGIPIAPLGYTDDFGAYQNGWKDLGYEPQTLINALALVGWNPGHDKEIMTVQEMIDSFDLDRVHKSGARFDMAKATWLNAQYIQHTIPNDELLKDLSLDPMSDDQLSALMTEAKKRCNFRKDFAPAVGVIFSQPDSSIDYNHTDVETAIGIIDSLNKVTDWTFDNISDSITTHITSSGIKSSVILSLLRKMVLYNQHGIDVKNSMFILGKSKTLERITNYSFRSLNLKANII